MKEVVRRLSLLIFLCMLLPLPLHAAGLVNINTADATALETLSGIGVSKATAIIQYRTDHGAFASINDIMNVSGIGTATFANIKDYITVDDSSTGQDTQTQPTQDQSQSQSSTTTSQTQTQTAPSVTVEATYVPPPPPAVYADAGADRTVIVGADTEFDASAYDKDRVLIDPSTVRFLWNFGDGQTQEGESVLHHYQYPGTYALILNIAQNKSAAMDEMVVTAEPAKLSFETLPDGGVEIDNLAGRDLDLSGWIVRAGPGLLPALFTLPPHSIILSSSSMRISRTTLGFIAGAQSELDYPNGVVALDAGQTTAPQVSAPSAAVAPVVAPAPAPIVTSAAKHSVQVASTDAEIPSTDEMADESVEATDAATSTETAAAAPVAGAFSPWWLAAIALAGLAAIALIVAKKVSKNEWDIVEEK